MTAPHFFAASVAGERVEITGEEARHAVRVLRILPGEPITVSDGAGTVVDAHVTIAGRTLVAEVTGRRLVPRSSPRIVVFQAIAKGVKFDLVVQKLTEIGVDEIVPVAAARSVARWEGPAKVDRLRVVAREAAKQSRRAWLPTVGDPVPTGSIPVTGTVLMLHEEAERGVLGVLPESPPESLSLLIGPEGGFSPDEVGLLEARGALVVTLGPQVLRTETAGLVTAALIMGRYGLLG